MNKLVVVLAACTAASASAAVYFRYQLMEERARNATLLESRAASETAAVSAPFTPVTVPAAAPAPTQALPERTTTIAKVETPVPTMNFTPQGVPALRDPGPSSKISVRPEMRKQAAEFLKKYDDLFGRNVLREQARDRARRMLEGFDEERDLEPGKFEKLVALMADQELEKRVVQSRCLADPSCESPAGFAELFASHRQAIDDLIGPGGSNAVRDWSSTQLVRRMVKGFSARLPATAQLSGAQNTAFVEAMKTERAAAMQEWSASHEPVAGFGNVDGMMVMYLSQAATIEERMASAQAYVQRMKDRAATVLNGQQLLVYNQMQDELLFDLQRHLQNRERREREGS